MVRLQSRIREAVGATLLVAGLLVPLSVRAGEFRTPAVAGYFYERSPFVLDRQVTDLLTSAQHPAVTGRLVAAVCPHAGYPFSGKVAAAVYSQLASGAVARVVLLGPAHHGRVQGVTLPDPAVSAYYTPLGVVPIDTEACRKLKELKGFVIQPAVAVREHSLEVQLPFLQKTVTSFTLIPLLCGPADAVDIDAVAGALAPLLASNTLMIASSDFTHFGPNYGFTPFSNQVPRELRAWLDLAAGQVARLDEAAFVQHCQETGDTICGEVPIRILMATLKRAGLTVAGRVLDRSTSGDVAGSFDNSVSYAAIGFFAAPRPISNEQSGIEPREEHAVKEHRSGRWTPGLSEAEKSTLFAIARDTLAWCVAGRKGPFDFTPYALTPKLKGEAATFVTLKIKGRLRGCIGSLAPVEALYLSVHGNAINAALRDPRFSPVTTDELARLSVDVSILSPVQDLASIAEFQLGRQGIILEKAGCRAVYLPEVATEQGWSVEETLASLSEKAGLPPEAWRQGARFQVFESAVLSE